MIYSICGDSTGGSTYDPSTHFCSGRTIYLKCGGSDYNPSTHFCSGGTTVKTYSSTISYGGQTYKIMVIGSQTWFAENLNYEVSGSECYGNYSASCETYGRLYDWSTAMNLPSSCNSNSCSGQIHSMHQGICPSGWHIPSYTDWKTLMDFVESYSDCSFCAQAKLKSTTGWYDCGPSDSGNSYLCEDIHGFSALPGGLNNSGFVGVTYAGYYGFWWSSTENDEIYAYDHWNISTYGDGHGFWCSNGKSCLFSVRCLKDD